MERLKLSERRISELRGLIYEHGRDSVTPDHPYLLIPLRTPDGEVPKWWSADEIEAVKQFLSQEMECEVLISGRDTHVDISPLCGKWAGIEAFLS